MQRDRINSAIRLGAMLITLGLLGGCETYGPTGTEVDFGNSVRSMVRNQSVNPGPADAEPADAADGVRTRNTIEVYRTDVTQPEDMKRELVIGVDGR